MKYKIILLTTLMLSVLCGTASADEPEFRAVWVHNWLPGLLTPAEVDSTIKWATDSNMNAVIAQVRRVGDAYYNSAYEPRALNIKGDSDFDPLAYTIQQSRANNLEIHAWFNVFRVATAGSPLPTNHITTLHPEWLSRDDKGVSMSADGQFLDPGVPAVREYLVSLISDIVSKYDIDGISLDFIRYPGKRWGYNSIAVDEFNKEYGRTGKPAVGDPQWCDWRRRQVTETVRAIRSEIERLKPGVKLSAATISWGACPADFSKTDAYVYVFQDWRLWMEQGLLDANMPMNYQSPSTAKNRNQFADWLDGMKRWSYGRQSYCGMMIFKNNINGAAEQVKTVRKKGVDGIVGFAFSQVGCRDALASRLKTTVLAKPASVHSMPWKNEISSNQQQCGSN
ncbi:MAG: glycoside hydrolase family 10 protein [Armatimonadota bacterium]